MQIARVLGGLLLTASMTLSGCATTDHAKAPADQDYQGKHADFVAIQHVLDARARAVLEHHRSEFLATVDRADHAFHAAQERYYDNLTRFPLRRVSFRTEDFGLVHPFGLRTDDPLVSPPVTERVQVAGAFRAAVPVQLQQTWVKRAGHWLIAAERIPPGGEDTRGTAFRPWGGKARIDVAHDASLVVVVDADQHTSAEALLERVKDDQADVARELGLPPDSRLLFDATSTGRPAEFGPIEREQAAAVTFGLWSDPDPGFLSTRAATVVKVNPQQVGRMIGRPGLLRHELTHARLARYADTAPTWLNEGIATLVELRTEGEVGLRLIDKAVAEVERKFPKPVLPTATNFQYETDASYYTAFGAVGWLVDRYGMPRVLDLFEAFRRSVDADGRTTDTQDAVLRRSLGIGEARLAREARSAIAGD